ncbi:ribbon-helix-helix domain-containing protein [Aeromonas dhakensis]|uniref:ribbon-helix-helix domain-containing protein n=1 Tax=Aeromonas dhakensis TaxID=196024 RepID=UPI0005A7B6DD|nr:ribbon-helix-helix protein, CopG family [Aeromonas dhakensis]
MPRATTDKPDTPAKKPPFTIRLDEAALAKLDEWAAQEHRSRANLVQKILAEAIERHTAE